MATCAIKDRVADYLLFADKQLTELKNSTVIRFGRIHKIHVIKMLKLSPDKVHIFLKELPDNTVYENTDILSLVKHLETEKGYIQHLSQDVDSDCKLKFMKTLELLLCIELISKLKDPEYNPLFYKTLERFYKFFTNATPAAIPDAALADPVPVPPAAAIPVPDPAVVITPAQPVAAPVPPALVKCAEIRAKITQFLKFAETRLSELKSTNKNIKLLSFENKNKLIKFNPGGVYDYLKNQKYKNFDIKFLLNPLYKAKTIIEQLPQVVDTQCNWKYVKLLELLLCLELITKLRHPNHDTAFYDTLEQFYERSDRITPAAPPTPEQYVQADITNLLAEGERTDIENFLFSTRSLTLLNERKFTDLSRNNLYFNIDFGLHKLTPKTGQYYNRTFAEYAELLRAMLETGRPGLKTLQYPATMPVTNAGKMVTSVIADMNHDFKYIEPRLNALNTTTVSSFFTSNKALAVNRVLNKTKKAHETDFKKYKEGRAFAYKQGAIKNVEDVILAARRANAEKNNVATAQELQKAKDNFELVLDTLIREAKYEEEKQLYQKEKARVLSNKDLYRRIGQQLWETEAHFTDAATARPAATIARPNPTISLTARAFGGRTRKRR